MPCSHIAEALDRIDETFSVVDWVRHSGVIGTTFALVAAAEMGDKSQLVCMMLASRHRHSPVLWGSILAFALLNVLAVLLGTTVAHWLPEHVVALAVGLLFLVFGLSNLLVRHDAEAATLVETPGRGVFMTTFLMIFLAELGDKTQIAVAGLSATEPPVDVWLGATLALMVTSALGIWAGKALLRRLPPRAVSLASGVLFLAFACFAFWKVMPPEFWYSLPQRVQDALKG